MAFFRRSRTRSLTGVRLELAAGRSRLRLLLVLLVVLLLGAAAYAGVRYFDAQFSAAMRADTLEKENVELRKSLESERMALEVEKATRAELEKQLSELNDEVKKLQTEVVFYKSQAELRP